MIRIMWQLKTWFNCVRNRSSAHRRLEIGSGPHRVPGFETLDVTGGRGIDYVCDAARKLPFPDSTFEVVYASHVLEHVPWYQTESTVREWIRILKSDGQLEIWVPNGLLICQALVDFEIHDRNYIHLDGWFKFNQDRDPCVWAAGRLFTYGDGTGDPRSPNWHRALFTPRYLKHVMTRCGLDEVVEMNRSEVRGYDHGWINLGMKGRKRELSKFAGSRIGPFHAE